jgi:arylsulfatase A-like enzyme
MGWDTKISRNESSLAKCLQQAGYTTGVVGKWHNFPNDAKFQRAHILPHNPTVADYQKPGAAAGIRANYDLALAILRDGYGWDFVDRININNTVFNLEWLVEGALNFIEQNKGGPFFLYVALPVPHGQYTTSYCEVASLDPRATPAGLIDKLPDVMPSRASVYERLRQAGIAAENAMGTHMDDAVGALLDKLERSGVRHDTLVFFAGDNPSRGKNSTFEGAREPAIVNWPARIKPGTRVDCLCANTDVAATLVAAAGGSVPADIAQDSHSFLPQLLGQPAPADWPEAVLLEIGNTKAVVTRRWKYIANRVPEDVATALQADARRAARTGKPRKLFWTGLDHHSYGAENDFANYFDADQLYDLDADLYETSNLAANPERAATLAEMQGRLRQLLAPLPHGFGEFKAVTAQPVKGGRR